MNIKWLIGVIIALLVGAAGGYYVGYDHGYEKAVGQVESAQTGGEVALSVSETAARILGKWQSMEDAKFTREFKNDGSMADLYEGDASATTAGTWDIWNLEDGFVYVKIIMENQNFHYKVAKLDDNELELIYLDRGGTLKFSRVR